ncbi:C1QL [Mytilus edulis]|uniref:C1QL n=1 Tax=Mytilus edulis TaxID=6550 RepID=A0A8S3RL15_MYTED|nr:C1QL [Mytilus edulis]
MLFCWIILTLCCIVATLNGEHTDTSQFDFVMKELDSLRHDFQVKYERLEAENTNLKKELASVRNKRLLLGTGNVGYSVEIVNGESSETSKVDFIMKELGTLRHDFNDLHSKYENLEAENMNLKRELDLAKNKRQLSDGIGFYARRKPSGTLGAQQTIEFEHVHENHGNGYDSLQGHFTAPVSGLYQFSTTIYSMDNYGVHCEMVKNGQNLGQLLAPVPGYASSTLNVVIYLSVGDQVWVRHLGSASEHLNANDYSSFSGFLISL